MSRNRPPVPQADVQGIEPDRYRWRTPRYLFDPLHAEFRFDLDAAASSEDTLCPRFLGRADNCLYDRPWGPQGTRAWYNPPYGRVCADFPGTGAFAEAAAWQAEHHGILVVALLDAATDTATDTAWWRRLFLRASEVRLLPRVHFLAPDGTPGPQPPGGSSVFVLEPRQRPRRVGLWDPKTGWGL